MASLILSQAKRYENRNRPTNYRGWLVIHAASTLDDLGHASRFGLERDALVRGAFLGVVRVVACHPKDHPAIDQTDIHAEGPNCWVLEEPIPFETPIPGSGQLGLGRVPPHVLVDPLIQRLFPNGQPTLPDPPNDTATSALVAAAPGVVVPVDPFEPAPRTTARTAGCDSRGRGS